MPAYEFKAGAHIPKGVTVDGIMAERDQIEHDFGKCTIENAVDAVLKDPDGYPNLRAFGPEDDEDAMRRGITEGIRRAFRVVVIRREEPDAKPAPRQVRVVHSVQDEDGDTVYQKLTVIRESPAQRQALWKHLNRDVESFTDKMRDTLAELEALG